MITENYYKILDLPNFTTDQSVIRDAYLKKIKQYHPDTTKISKEVAEEESKKINVAYDVLSNPQKKMDYDYQLRASMTSPNISKTTYSSQTNYNYSRNYQNNNQYYRTSRPNYYGTNRSRYAKTKNPFRYLLIMFLIYGLISALTPSSSSANTSNNKPTATVSPTPTQNIKIEYPVVDVDSGEILRYPRDEMLAPLGIKTSSGYNYYISLEDLSNDGYNNMSFYVKGGDYVEMDIPLGTYNIYYAVGKEWYGVFAKFGDTTSYYKCEGTFNFTNDGTYYNGYELILYKVPNGNMGTETVAAEDFPN